MRTLDSYILRQTLIAFAFFCLILGGLIWLTQAVRLIDTVLNSGQSLWRLAEFSLLVLPKVMALVVPVAGFAAALFTINKLYSEAELVVIMMSGLGPMGLARPMLYFGLIMCAITLSITVLFAPKGEQRLIENRAQIESELARSLIREGRFLHPVDGITIFIRKADPNGRMTGLFLHDQRDPDRPVTYTAERAELLRDGDIARMIMSQGAALTYSTEDRLLARIRFATFDYDLSALLKSGGGTSLKPDALPTRHLFFPPAELRAHPKFDRADLLAHGHERIILALDALLLPILALAVILTGGYQRRGFGKRIMLAIGAGFLMVVGGVIGKSVVSQTAALWPVNYLPILLAVLATLWLLRAGMRSRAAPVAEQAA